MNNNDIKAYCVKNGKTLAEIEGQFMVTDNLTDTPFISEWNVSGLTEPTQTQLDALTQAEKDVVTDEISDAAIQTQKINLQRDIDAGKALIADGHTKIDVSKLETALAAL